jgi:cellulose synthase/poly-beta-1,6-N-acetylglucosamine synthase-like glycosyltransferase
MIQFSLLLVLCLSGFVVLYTYAGFPLCLLMLTRGRRQSSAVDMGDEELPTVSVLIAAHNEERVIAAKVANCRSLDYPQNKIDFVFISDGSTDRTNAILSAAEGPQIQVKLLPGRNGKINALLAGFPMCRGDVLAMSDANTFYRPDALRKLVRHFREPKVGVVTGDVRLMPSEEAFGAGEGLYYRYERTLQLMESAFWSTVTVDGAMYALRRSLLRPPSYKEVPDDFVIGMNVVLQGYRMIYDPDAVAEEDPTPTNAQEFKRKVRIVAHGIQSFLAGEGVPSPRQFRVAWLYTSHKLLRWTSAVFVLAVFLSALVLALLFPSWAWLLLLWLQIGFYLLAFAGWKLSPARGPLFRVPYYFGMVHLAALVGLVRGLRKGERPVGIKTDRVAA